VTNLCAACWRAERVRPHPPSATHGSVPAAWARHSPCPSSGECGPRRVMPGFWGGAPAPAPISPAARPHAGGLGGGANCSHRGLPEARTGAAAPSASLGRPSSTAGSWLCAERAGSPGVGAETPGYPAQAWWSSCLSPERRQLPPHTRAHSKGTWCFPAGK